MYVASEDNPADDGTRNKSIKEPTCETPFYLQEALLGNFAPLDAELKKVGLDYVSLLDLPPLTSIRQSLGPVLEPCRRDCRRQWMQTKRRETSRTGRSTPSSSFLRSPSSSSLRTSRRVRQSTAPAEKPPSSPSRDCHGRRAPKGFEAATAEYEGERSHLLEPAPATAPLGKLPAETKQLLLSFDANQFVLPKGCKVPLYKLLERPGYLDLGSSRCCLCLWSLVFDFRPGPVGW